MIISKVFENCYNKNYNMKKINQFSNNNIELELL